MWFGQCWTVQSFLCLPTPGAKWDIFLVIRAITWRCFRVDKSYFGSQRNEWNNEEHVLFCKENQHFTMLPGCPCSSCKEFTICSSPKMQQSLWRYFKIDLLMNRSASDSDQTTEGTESWLYCTTLKCNALTAVCPSIQDQIKEPRAKYMSTRAIVVCLV